MTNKELKTVCELLGQLVTLHVCNIMVMTSNINLPKAYVEALRNPIIQDAFDFFLTVPVQFRYENLSWGLHDAINDYEDAKNEHKRTQFGYGDKS